MTDKIHTWYDKESGTWDAWLFTRDGRLEGMGNSKQEAIDDLKSKIETVEECNFERHEEVSVSGFAIVGTMKKAEGREGIIVHEGEICYLHKCWKSMDGEWWFNWERDIDVERLAVWPEYGYVAPALPQLLDRSGCSSAFTAKHVEIVEIYASTKVDVWRLNNGSQQEQP